MWHAYILTKTNHKKKSSADFTESFTLATQLWATEVILENSKLSLKLDNFRQKYQFKEIAKERNIKNGESSKHIFLFSFVYF